MRRNPLPPSARRRPSPGRCAAPAILVALALLAGAAPGSAVDLGSAQLQVAGTRLEVSPESQTVPFDTPTVVETALVGFDPAAGGLPPGLRVVGELTGPEIDGVLTLETVPGEPLRIPRLRLEGEYLLEDIRLVGGGELLAYASPRSVAVRVTQVLVTRVTSRALTLDEIRSYGIVLDEDSFHAFSFTFGFAVDGETYDYNVPVLYDRIRGEATFLGRERDVERVFHPRFAPPQLAPFTLELERTQSEIETGGCADLFNGCVDRAEVPLPG